MIWMGTLGSAMVHSVESLAAANFVSLLKRGTPLTLSRVRLQRN